MRFGILGSVWAAGDDGRAVPLGGARLRALLAMLLLDAGRPVPLDRLIDGVYGDRPPAGAVNALQSQVSRLRAALPVEFDGGGYRLAVDPDEVDAHRFTRLAAAAHDALATARESHVKAAALLREALGLWRGEPLSDVRSAPFAAAQVARLAEARLLAVEDLAEAELASGASRAVIGDLRDLVIAEPLRERAWALLMRALAADGRPAEALAAFETARHALADALGADPSPELSEVHRAILRGDAPGAGRVAGVGRVPEAERVSDAGGAPSPRDAATGAEDLTGAEGAAGAEDAAGVREPGGATDAGGPADAGHPPGPKGRDDQRDGTGGAFGVPAWGEGFGRHGVPEQLTRFVGRDEDLRAVAAALRTTRLVTLHGPGGSGKTRLAVETAARHAGEVRFVELAAATAHDVPRAVADAIGLRDGGLRSRDPRDAAPHVTERLTAALAARDVLLVLDNCEHVITETATLAARLLATCPGVRILATSREPLALTGETLHPIGGLPEPAAVELFLERAAQVAPGFATGGEETAAVREICRTLDGLPLALELAAARLHALPVREVAARVGDRFRLLNRGSRTAPERQRTLRAVVEWSWEPLSEPERALARRFTVFRGGCTLAAVEAVCGPDAVDLLGDLVGKSLVERDGDRYRMLETIRAFCAERLAESGEEPDVRAAHAEHFLAFARAADRELRTGRQLIALRRLDADRDNLHAALRDADPATGMRLLSALSFYWWLRGLRTEAADLARMLLRRRPGREHSEEYALCELTARLGSTTAAPEPARYLAGLTGPPAQPFLMYLSAIMSGPPAEGLEDVHTMHRRLLAPLRGDAWSWALGAIGSGWMVLLAGGSPAEAEPEFEEALRGFRALGERWGTMLALNGVAEMAAARGDHAAAQERMDEAMRLAGELDSTVDLADLLRSRADSRLLTGDLDGAAADLIRTAELAREAGAPELISAALLGLGRLALRRGDRAEARRLCRAALAECPVDWYGSYGVRVTILAVLGRIAELDGDDGTAGRLFREVFTVGPGPNGLAALGEALAGLVGLALRGGDPERAAILLGAAGALLIGSGDTDHDREQTATVREQLGEQAYRRGHAHGAALTRAEALAYALRA
ncbi:putative ATPase/DNA-binding SARP family transcriptional activator [Catenuloplanes nepalensis]|uniref:ATPase/DNA-binding SARP family transcriptional activator n=1 Tax=Catenuloplanes nepalensis TaxID=587533 RepID=A0ABT9MR91_9ACTN|nr:BTAD domain-containing putative transcriptional regulator [Catenuloplanes nepalensis]MDP9793957.1 putative ATPase/DNA-binding SARP family transcriptional activator [Catenuloplanes nepalensis]